jgi:hypothetical protein
MHLLALTAQTFPELDIVYKNPFHIHHHAEKAGNPTVRTVVSAGGRLFMLTDEIESSNGD